MHKQEEVFSNSLLHYNIYGVGSPLVLLHGFCGSQVYWKDIIEHLQGNYSLIVPDLPGHGLSPLASPYPLSMESMAKEILDILDHENIEQVTMLGHSLGGYITLAFAEAYPPRLLGFGLVHSHAFTDSEQARQTRVETIQRLKTEGIVPVVDQIVPGFFATVNTQSNSAIIAQAKAIGYATEAQGAIAVSQAMLVRPDRNHVIAKSSLPVCLIAGEKDRIVRPERMTTANCDRIRRSVIPDAGHMSMFEAPKLLSQEIGGFLNTIL